MNTRRIVLTLEERRYVRLLSALADVDERTGAKAFRYGTEAVKHHEPRLRIQRAMDILGGAAADPG
jgi:hypothetical protein